MSSAADTRRWLLGAVVAALAVHAVTLANGFCFDDATAVLANRVVTGDFSPRRLMTSDFWGTPDAHVGTWRPLPVMTWWLDWRLGGGRPWAFHLGNVLWHALATAALWAALRRHVATAMPAALLFAVLGVGSEAVASVVGRADVMAAALAFAAWAMLPRGDEGRSAWAAAALLLGALLCKESAVVLPLAFFAVDALDGRPRRVLARYGPLALALAAWLALRLVCLGPLHAPTSLVNNALYGAPLWVRALTGLELLALTLRVTLLPLNLSPDYSWPELPAQHGLSTAVLLGAFSALALAGIAWYARRRDRALAGGLVFFGASWLVVSNVFILLPTLFAERLLYLPAAGLAVALWRALAPLRAPLRWSLLLALVAGNAALAVRHDRAWRDELSLFRVAVEVSPRAARSWLNYCAALNGAGRKPEAMAACQRSVELLPDLPKPWAMLGVMLDETQQPGRAVAAFERARALDPSGYDGAHNYAVFLARHRQPARAIEVLTPYVAAHPGDAATAAMLAELRAAQ